MARAFNFIAAVVVYVLASLCVTSFARPQSRHLKPLKALQDLRLRVNEASAEPLDDALVAVEVEAESEAQVAVGITLTLNEEVTLKCITDSWCKEDAVDTLKVKPTSNLGQGAFGTAYAATITDPSDHSSLDAAFKNGVVVKVPQKSSTAYLADLRAETQACFGINGAGAVKCLMADNQVEYMALVMEPVDMIGIERSDNLGKFADATKMRAHAVAAITALESLHATGYSHGDIRGPNMGYSGTAVKYIDLGKSRLRANEATECFANGIVDPKCLGSPDLFGPAVEKNPTPLTLELFDLWSLGLHLFRANYGVHPFLRYYREVGGFTVAPHSMAPTFAGSKRAASWFAVMGFDAVELPAKTDTSLTVPQLFKLLFSLIAKRKELDADTATKVKAWIAKTPSDGWKVDAPNPNKVKDEGLRPNTELMAMQDIFDMTEELDDDFWNDEAFQKKPSTIELVLPPSVACDTMCKGILDKWIAGSDAQVYCTTLGTLATRCETMKNVLKTREIEVPRDSVWARINPTIMKTLKKGLVRMVVFSEITTTMVTHERDAACQDHCGQM